MDMDTILKKVYHRKFTKSSFASSCAICGGVLNVEIHHVRSVKDLRSRSHSN